VADTPELEEKVFKEAASSPRGVRHLIPAGTNRLLNGGASVLEQRVARWPRC